MGIEITHLHFGSTPHTHEAITNYRWRNEQTGEVKESSKATLVDWIDNKGGVAHVGQGYSQVDVETVHPTYGVPYLRTVADGAPTNNLLSLPTF